MPSSFSCFLRNPWRYHLCSTPLRYIGAAVHELRFEKAPKMKKTMQAVGVIPRKREVRLIEHHAPQISANDEVRIRALEVGICGTDKEICTFVYGAPPAGSEYLVLGHESLGQVVEVGTAVRDLKPGDLVVPSV